MQLECVLLSDLFGFVHVITDTQSICDDMHPLSNAEPKCMLTRIKFCYKD